MDQQIFQWIIIGITIAFVAIEKARKLLGNNPGKHGERIATLEEAAENIEKRLDRIEKQLNGTR